MTHHKQPPHLAHPEYRPDIDGLRAIAILVVVIFHAFPKKVPAGFIGVDIFFVVSGFLISTIIFSSLERDRFSMIEFYVRRVRRIFPALILVLISCLAFGWFVLFTEEYKQLGKHAAAAAGFLQNFVLWRESGYFDNSAQTKPLLHLWSLAIEEQFYIFWPLLLVLVWKRRWSFLGITAVIAAISFATNIYLTLNGRSTAAFYLPFSRFWELMVGSVLAYVVLHRPQLIERHREAQSFFGFALIFTGLLLLNKGIDYPGAWALLPTMGAFFIISAGPGTWLNEKLLANKLMVWIGLISYPLYLWHWSILSFSQILQPGEHSALLQLGLITLSIFLAWLTLLLVERPVRFGKKSKIKVAVISLSLAVVGLFGFYAFSNDGIKSRMVANLNSIMNTGLLDFEGKYIAWNSCGLTPELAKEINICISDARGSAEYFLYGDSKSSVLFPGIFKEAGKTGYWAHAGNNGKNNNTSSPVISDYLIHSSNQYLTREVIKQIAKMEKIKVVVLAASIRGIFNLKGQDSIDDLPESKNYEAAFEGLDNVVSILVKGGKKVVFVIDNPTLKDAKMCIGRTSALTPLNALLQKKIIPGCQVSYDHQIELSKQYRDLLENISKKYPKYVRIYDPLKSLCDMSDRQCRISIDGRLLYSVTDHLSAWASGRIAKELVPFVVKFGGEN